VIEHGAKVYWLLCWAVRPQSVIRGQTGNKRHVRIAMTKSHDFAFIAFIQCGTNFYSLWNQNPSMTLLSLYTDHTDNTDQFCLKHKNEDLSVAFKIASVRSLAHLASHPPNLNDAHFTGLIKIVI